MTLRNNRAPLLCCFQMCAWFHCHMWIQTGVRVRKRLSWVLTSVTLTFDLWPWPFAWTSLLTMVITPENFMMIRWWEHGEKGVTDGRTDRQTDGQTDWSTENTICRAAWSRLKNKWISEIRRTNLQELKCRSTFCVNYFLRYYLMMQHQPIMKRVNATHGWAHRPYQLLSAPYNCCLYKQRRQDERQPLQSSWPVPICT